MGSPLGQRALVMGGSMAGLLTARVLSDFFAQVTLIERDVFPSSPEARKGVPQGRHAHALLARGEQALSRLFPGITDDLVAGGGCCGDMGEIMRWYQFGGYKLRHHSGLNDYTQSRPYLEWHVRRRLAELPNVEMLDDASVKQLQTGGEAVRGIAIERHGESFELAAELTVDCTGRGSRAPRYLEQMGFQAPRQTIVPVDVGYATCYYQRDPKDRQVTLIFPKPPEDRRGAAIMPIEGDRWICTLGGWLGDHPPTDPEGFLAFAKSLAAPDAYEIISQAERLSEPVPHKFPANLRNHYEELTRFPSGYVVLGDAVCSFNPLYGQGMTSSSLQTEALEKALRRGLGAEFPSYYFHEVAMAIEHPWQMAISEDFRFPEVTGQRPRATAFAHRYGSMVHRAATKDAEVYGRFLRVLNLMEPPTALMRPGTALRVLRAAF